MSLIASTSTVVFGSIAPKPHSTQWLEKLVPSFREFPREVCETLDIVEIGGVPVLHAVTEKFVGAQNDFLPPVALSTAELDFGVLEESQFMTLRREFGGLSEVGYDPERQYEVVDFLPPTIQALLNQDLEIPDAITLPESAEYAYPPMGEDVPVDLTANCHGTSWEAMRSFQGCNDSANIFLGEAGTIDQAFESEVFQKIGIPGKSQPQGLEPGDVIAFDEQSDWARLTMLLHTATYVGGGLFFEKPNTESQGEDSPYRLATWEMLTAPVEQYVEGRWEAQAYRPTRDLEPGSERFRSDQLDTWQEQHGLLDKPVLTVIESSLGGGIRGLWNTAMASVPLQKRPDGRFELSEVFSS